MTRLLGIVLAASFAVTGVSAQPVLDSAFLAQRRQEALIALDRYLETWNSRNGTIWATSLHFPHVRPGPGAFEMTRTPEEYAKGVNFEQTLKTGWHHSEWVTRTVLQVGWDKVHASGTWQRYTADGKPLAGSDITYIITRQGDHWGVQARFAAGVNGLEDGRARHQRRRGAQRRHRVLRRVEYARSGSPRRDASLSARARRRRHGRDLALGRRVSCGAGARVVSAPGSRRASIESTVAQVTANGANVTVRFSRLGRDGTVLSTRRRRLPRRLA